MTWKPKSWLWMGTMPNNEQKEVLSLDGIMGCYSCLAQVYLEVECKVILLKYERLRVEICNYESLSKDYYMNIMYLICSFKKSYVDLWLYNANIGDYAYKHVIREWLSLMVTNFLRCYYYVIIAFILCTFCTNAYFVYILTKCTVLEIESFWKLGFEEARRVGELVSHHIFEGKPIILLMSLLYILYFVWAAFQEFYSRF